MSGTRLNPAKVPAAVSALVPLAEKWGISDDVEREEKVHAATDEELRQLVASLEAIDSDALFEWLAGPESYDASPTDEYVAFTALTMAIESAKLILKRAHG